MILAIDPGPEQSAFVVIDEHLRPVRFGKVGNDDLLANLERALGAHRVVIEMVASYGMAVGAEVFQTCVWIGRFVERIQLLAGLDPELIYRRDVKLHHCGQVRAKDANVRQALIDRFGDKGTKAQPGWFYGFAADVWQAYALAVFAAEARTALSEGDGTGVTLHGDYGAFSGGAA